MHFIKLPSQEEARQLLFNEISNAVKQYGNVAWFNSGGRNVELAASVFNMLSSDDLARLTLMLVDERLGEPGHADSNYYQLAKAGIDFSRVKNYPVLEGVGTSLEDVAAKYSIVVKQVLEQSDYSIGLLGIGEDGHTAGILPHSPATAVNGDLVVGYKGADFSRITLSFEALRQLSKVLVFAFGESKRPAILNLSNKELSLDEAPAQIFRQLPNAYIINNMIGDKL